jgi:hypothetical protein
MLPVFPSLPGLAWGITRKPMTSTRQLIAASAVEYRAQNWQVPLYQWTLPIEFLRQRLTYTEWATLEAFILNQGGMFNTWLFSDLSTPDFSVTNQPIGTGNGTQVSFPLVRSFGGFAIPVNYVNTVSSVSIAGTPTIAYTITQTGYYGPDTINFNSPPANAAAITANFSYYFTCRFLSDEPEFENFIGGRSAVKSLEFKSVK